jgi:hypothetical protein
MPIRRADDSTYILASNLSATGTAVPIKGGEYQFSAEGTVGGSTISLQFQTPNGTWSDLLIFAGSPVKSTTLPFTQTQIDLPAGNVRMAVTGGSPSGLYSYLVGLG